MIGQKSTDSERGGGGKGCLGGGPGVQESQYLMMFALRRWGVRGRTRDRVGRVPTDGRGPFSFEQKKKGGVVGLTVGGKPEKTTKRSQKHERKFGDGLW